MFEIIRNKSFWGLDFVKGHKVKRHLEDIRFTLENFSSKESKRRRERALDNILEHAAQTTQFYGNKAGKRLQDFPIVDKNLIRENFNDFVSSQYQEKDLSRLVTSGSTGTPFTVLQDNNKKYRNTADTIYFCQSGGF